MTAPVYYPPYKGLTPKQEAFVEAFAAMGQAPNMAWKAVIESNPDCGHEKSARAMAYKYLQNPRILAALRERADSAIKANAPKAQQVVEQIMAGEFNGAPVKPETALKAAQNILDRAGLQVVSKVEHTIEDNRTAEELAQSVNELLARCAEQGILTKDKVIDITAVPVHPDPEIEKKIAPWGRNKDGTPSKPPGPRTEKRFLPGPEAYTPEEHEAWLQAARDKRAAERAEIEKLARELVGE